jgi:transcription elongation factor GreB
VSKAFTREADEAGADELPFVRPQLPPGSRNYITQDGADRLKQRLQELLETKRAWAATSAEAGPTPEADRQRVESSIRKLQEILDSVVVAGVPGRSSDKVGVGATVMVRHGNGEEEAYQIVGVDEASPERGRISWISPLGAGTTLAQGG